MSDTNLYSVFYTPCRGAAGQMPEEEKKPTKLKKPIKLSDLNTPKIKGQFCIVLIFQTIVESLIF